MLSPCCLLYTGSFNSHEFQFKHELIRETRARVYFSIETNVMKICMSIPILTFLRDQNNKTLVIIIFLYSSTFMYFSLASKYKSCIRYVMHVFFYVVLLYQLCYGEYYISMFYLCLIFFLLWMKKIFHK